MQTAELLRKCCYRSRCWFNQRLDGHSMANHGGMACGKRPLQNNTVPPGRCHLLIDVRARRPLD